MTSPLVRTESVSVSRAALGMWRGNRGALRHGDAMLAELLARIDRPVYAVAADSGTAFTDAGEAVLSGAAGAERDISPLLGFAAPCLPEALGDPSFRADHGLR